MNACAERRLEDALFDEGGSFVAFLDELGAARIAHGGRSLRDHLVGTAVLLSRWGANHRLQVAGLFHSVYGTEVFGPRLLPFAERRRLRMVAGEDVERLVLTFCVVRRASIFRAMKRGEPYRVDRVDGGQIALNATDFVDLTWLLIANDVEQAACVGRLEHKTAWMKRLLELGRRVLSERAIADLSGLCGASSS